MATTEEKAIDLPKTAPNALAAAQQAQPEKTIETPSQAPAPQQMSKGEKWFNWGIYKGLNYWVNLGMSLVITDLFVHRPGKKFWDGSKKLEKWAETLEKTSFIPLGKNRHTNAKNSLETFMLLSGGNILLVPMKLLEDRKRQIVHWLNDKMGVDQTAADGHKMTADEIYIENEQPKQGWLRVIGRRLLSIGAVVGVGQILNEGYRDRTHPMPEPGQSDPHGGKARATDDLLKYVNKGLNSGYVPGGKLLATNDYSQAYLKFAMLDVFFTKLTAVIMEMTNGAKPKKAKKEKSIDVEPQEPVPAPITDAVEVETTLASPPQTGYADRQKPNGREEITRQLPLSFTEKAVIEGQQPMQRT